MFFVIFLAISKLLTIEFTPQNDRYWQYFTYNYILKSTQ